MLPASMEGQNTASRYINMIRTLEDSVCHDGLRHWGSIWKNVTPQSFVSTARMGCALGGSILETGALES